MADHAAEHPRLGRTNSALAPPRARPALIRALFDRKFGPDFLAGLPRGPGVYLYRDGTGQVLYVGKAKDLRQRLAGYRAATRRKAHRKMGALVRAAASLEIIRAPSEVDALLLENRLIQSIRPPFNVDGAFSFLYPAIGVGEEGGRVVLAFTSAPSEWNALAVRWHGCFRSRARARAAFEALVALFGRLGHREPPSRRPAVPRRRGARLEVFRRLPAALSRAADDFFSGESAELLGLLFQGLLDSASARRGAEEVEEQLRALAEFASRDVTAHRAALEKAGRSGWVPGEERDALFIAARYRGRPEPGVRGAHR